MQFVFLDMAGTTLFVRDDAERAEWTKEEYTVDLEFPYLSDKVISIGQRIFFKDPDTGAHQIYEVKQAKTYQPDAYQSIVAEHICVSELSDEHMDNADIEDKTASETLETVLNGTLWSKGNVEVNPTSSGSLSRGSVWQNVLLIKDNWNVYIEPKVTLADDGTITRKLNIKSTDGEFNGVRLSVDKNMLDPSVTFDDSDVATALYGYGGTIVATSPRDDDRDCLFTDIVWEATSEHPAKPAGQNYIEDPAATAEYGRNGRARFGFYQNNDITDPETLLKKTWESLQTVSKPRISIDGTVADLYRMGYADQPLDLHDIALVEVLPAGYKQQAQIIKMTVDLLDPSSTTLTIGSYIPNIIYIEKKTNESATGSRGGGGKNTSDETTWQEFRTTIQAYKDGTGMQIKAVQNDIDITNEEVAVQTARIDVAYNKIEMEVEDRRNADGVLASKITQTATEIRAEVSDGINSVNSTISQTASQIRSEVAAGDSALASSITQTASQIRSEVAAGDSALASSITQTASQIRSEVSDSVNSLNSSITQTASQIRSEVADSNNGLQSQITQNANKISLVVTQDGQGNDKVDSASIVAGINSQTGSYVKIQAAKINLSGYVTATDLETTNAKITNLEAGNTVASALKATLLQANTSFNFKGYLATWRQFTFKDANNTDTTATFMVRQN